MDYKDDENLPWILSNKIPLKNYKIYQTKDGFCIKRKVFQGWIKVKELTDLKDYNFISKYFITEEIAVEYIKKLSEEKILLKPNPFFNIAVTIISLIILSIFLLCQFQII